MGLLTLIKSNLRISNSTLLYDDELEELISQCIEDLQASGLTSDAFSSYGSVTWNYDIELTDANLRRLITLYCKANFGLNNPDKDWYIKQYLSKKAEV